MKIAIVGGGVSGLLCARLLHSRHEVLLYEAAPRLGGHAWTRPVEHEGREFPVDLGFVVYNETTYPNFTRLLSLLGVATQQTNMSFSVRSDSEGLEYCGSSFNSLFAQRRNLLRRSFLRMLRDIVRFNERSPRALETVPEEATLGAYLSVERYSEPFIRNYIQPMGSAIWSATGSQLLEMPFHFFVRFFRNHGLLGYKTHLPWKTVRGGSRRYVEKLVDPFRDRILTGSPVRRVGRAGGDGVFVESGRGREFYDHVVMATHADVTLALLDGPTRRERDLLGRFPYQSNAAVLHTDASLLPRRKRARASWNYFCGSHADEPVNVTYDMSRLQGLATRTPICVTLNATDRVDRTKVIARTSFKHPVFRPASIEAQRKHGEISGADRIHYCGAYWGNGFHEDGVNSALAVAKTFDADLSSC